MHLLLVFATPGESALLREALPFEAQADGTWQLSQGAQRLTLLHTGLGMVNTAWTLARWAAVHPDFDRALHLGIAGSYRRDWPLGQVVQVVEDSFPELGADAPGGFLDLEQLGFPLWERPGQPLYNTLRNPQPWAVDLPAARGVTVNRVQGTEAGIAEMARRWQPEVESMEGAAFFYAMLRLDKPFAAWRSLSNYVEPRNREAWQIGPALRSLIDVFLAWWNRHP